MYKIKIPFNYRVLAFTLIYILGVGLLLWGFDGMREVGVNLLPEKLEFIYSVALALGVVFMICGISMIAYSYYLKTCNPELLEERPFSFPFGQVKDKVVNLIIPVFRLNEKTYFLTALIATSIIGFFHFLTVSSPPLFYDEALFADCAVNNQISHWTGILPPSLQFLTNYNYCGMFPLFFGLLEIPIRLFGLGVVQMRSIVLAAGIINLFLILIFIRKIGLPSVSYIGVIIYGLSYVFFYTFHQARPYSFNILIVLLNLIWIFSQQKRLLGLICGAILGLGLIIHSSVILMVPLFPILIYFLHGREFYRRQSYAWWFIGILLGVTIVFHAIDIENLVLFKFITSGTLIGEPPIAEYGINLWGSITNLLKILSFWFQSKSIWHNFILLIMIMALFYQCRRFRSLVKGEKVLLLISSVFLISYMLMTASKTPFYTNYFFPWLLIQSVIVIYKTVCSKTGYERIDYFIFALLGLVIFSSTPKSHLTTDSLMYWVPIFIFLFFSNIFTNYKSFIAGGLLVFFSYFLGPSMFRCVEVVCKYAAPSTPLLFVFVLTLPWIIFKYDKGTLCFKGLNRVRPALLLNIFFILTFVGMLNHDRLAISGELKRKTMTDDYRALLDKAGTEERIIGPVRMWVENPDIRVQDSRALILPRGCGFNVPIVDSIFKYNPTLILWPEHSVRDLIYDARRTNKNIVIRRKKMWKTYIGNLVELELTEN